MPVKNYHLHIKNKCKTEDGFQLRLKDSIRNSLFIFNLVNFNRSTASQEKKKLFLQTKNKASQLALMILLK